MIVSFNYKCKSCKRQSIIIKSTRYLMKSKSKKSASNRPQVAQEQQPSQQPMQQQQMQQQPMPQQPQQQQSAQFFHNLLSNQQPPQQQMTNAQLQQMMGQQQAPQVVPNPLFTNAQMQMNRNVQPIYQQAPQRQQGLGVYGRTRGEPMEEELPSIFNDDEPYVESVKNIGKQKEGKVDITLVAQRSQVKLGEVTVLPAMCKVISSGGNRTSVDLICVIDVSGSMSGEKINLVKQTMKVLIETLTPSDRLSIVTFNSSGRRICPLKAVTPENMVTLNNHVNELYSSGGTNIMSGMSLALKTLRDRKLVNTATSVFLLSDGQDKGAENQLKQALATEENKDVGVFSIHSFGFGNDHDEDLMNKICLLKDGSFYFIKELSTLDEAFCNALGGIISMVANEVIINVRCIASGIVEGIKISKVFGKKWEKINDNQYRIKITQMMSEVSKEFVFELTIPAIGGEVGDIGRENVVLEGIMGAKGINNQQMAGACNLTLTLINAHEEIAQVNQNVEVIENYLIEKASEAIEENMKKAEENKFEEAQQGIDFMINNIQSNKKARKEKMDVLVKDLQQIREKCSHQDYHQEGKKWMVSAQNAHSNRAGYQYQNCVQSDMVQERKMKKSMKP